MTVTLTRLMGATCAAALSLIVGAGACEAGTLTTVTNFKSGRTGAHPQGKLIQLGNQLFLTAAAGGGSGNGAISTVKIATGKPRLVSSFEGYPRANPKAGLIAMGDLLYGTTQYGGTDKAGTVFSFDPKTNALAIVSSLTQRDDLHPVSSLLAFEGKLYGTTLYGGLKGASRGSIFVTDPLTGDTVVLHRFSDDEGTNLYAPLIRLRGKLYGTAAYGGGHSAGTVFSYDLASRTERTVYNFTGVGDGSYPVGGLLAVDGSLYGTTAGDMGGHYGTIFRINPKTLELTTLHIFNNPGDGNYPTASLINVSGTLYGTTYGGGTFAVGTVFSFDLATGNESVVYSFTGGSDGARPSAPLIEIDGALYGTTSQGATGCKSRGCGTVFKYQP